MPVAGGETIVRVAARGDGVTESGRHVPFTAPGDVLAGILAAMRARGLPAFEAACAGVWLHGRAAEIAGPQMVADDLAAAIPSALALL
jgi:hypothetical protein